MISQYTIDELIDLISWEHFFYTWNVKSGTDAAAQLKQEALQRLDSLRDSLHVHYLYQIFEAYAADDDIMLNGHRIPFLRQQIPNSEGYCLCVSDFVRSQQDRVGIFATSVGQLVDPPSTVKCQSSTVNCQDPYASLLLQTLSDRLAEAAAERLQQQVAEAEGWVSRQIIRPAVGYPMIPDMSINFILDELCDLSRIGIQLTENGMMLPHASVSGFVIANPHACYFAVGPISEEQLVDYARRRGYTIERMRKFIKGV